MQLPDFHAAQILVCGDIMLDQYWHGQVDRLSPEAPVPVVQVQQQDDRPGGAANVAGNIVTLGGQATLCGLIGQDEPGTCLQQALAEANIRHQLVLHPTAATHTKLRILTGQQLLRVDNAAIPADPAIQDQLYQAFLAALPDHHTVILSDYAKGVLADPQPYIQACRKVDIPVLIDPKGTDYQRYRGATLLTPNWLEYTTIVGPCPDTATLVKKGRQLIQDCQLQALLVTRGEQGMTLLQVGRDPFHLPTQAREVYDVVGAGDTVIATLASALATGMALLSATRLANLAAGCVVGKRGTASVTHTELQVAYQTLYPKLTSSIREPDYRAGVLGETDLLAQVQAARARGERIVMTNGCFDILHAGHTECLTKAAELGDRLLVAVNTDASIRALKGPQRPINQERHRLQVLAALASVDWVVAFDELTPERLIIQIKPDILVKGAEYAGQQIVGADSVQQAGGEVKYIETDYTKTLSTSQIIATIQMQAETCG
ncbi:MAG: bifunctional D-glycero-beta-D-manno-heptose-7-phosphate kinase/D-glycero-beta-D-manno-heptose 1-phosphate adenylyltransferase HldE [Pseudomonadota bacterium]